MFPLAVVTPLQMLELEHLAILELGMTEDMMFENAATAIAQTARKLASQHHEKPSRKKRGRKGTSPVPADCAACRKTTRPDLVL